ncbi:MAG: ATP-dependent zinc protease family protein [Woeseiaceae bacterium]
MKSQESSLQVSARLLAPLVMATIAGCISPGSKSDSGDDESVVDVAPVVPVVVGPPEDLKESVPDACELLLSRLDETHPLLNDLDQTLAGQAARIEEALDQIRRPVPAPQIQECPAVSVGDIGNKEVIGAIEWLYLEPPGRHYRARIDSGAETSSLSASSIVEFERDSDDWVRFTFQHNPEEEPIELELPVKRVILIRQPSTIQAERRVVVEIDIRLGEELQTTEFALTDRSHMTYPMLLGRAFLMDIYVLDVSRSYIHERYEAS